MNRARITTLLQGLPDSAEELLRAVYALEVEGKENLARDLLVQSLSFSAPPRLHLELARRLYEMGRHQRGLELTEPLIDAEDTGEASLLAALLHQGLGEEEKVLKTFTKAVARGVPAPRSSAFRAYFFRGGPRPPLPFSEPPEILDFQTSESTHLINLDNPKSDLSWDSEVDGPTEYIRLPEEDSLAGPSDETYVRMAPDFATQKRSSRENKRPGSPAPSPPEQRNDETHLASFSLPLRQELYEEGYKETQEAEESGEDLRLQRRSPEVTDFEQPFFEFDKAFSIDDSIIDDSSIGPKSSDIDEEVWLPEEISPADRAFEMESYQSGKSQHLIRPGATKKKGVHRDSSPRIGPRYVDDSSLELDESALRSSRVRQFTMLVRERAESQFIQALRSPFKALLVATFCAAMVLFLGATLLYSFVAERRLSSEVGEIYRALDADLYSSHLAAFRDIQELKNFHLFPPFIEGPLRGAASLLPGKNPGRRIEEIEELEFFIATRMSYRFEYPGSYRRYFSDLPDLHGPLPAAARAYIELGSGDLSTAMARAEGTLSNSNNPLVSRAYVETLLATARFDLLRPISASLPRGDAASTFISLQVQNGLSQDDKTNLLSDLEESRSRFSAHVGIALLFASTVIDLNETSLFNEVGELLDEIVAPTHPHASPKERADAHRLLGNLQVQRDESSEGLLRALQHSADSNSRDPQSVAPYIDLLHASGQTREALRFLSAVPSQEVSHPYFSIEQSRYLLLMNEGDQMGERLELFAFQTPEATALLAYFYLLVGDYGTSKALIESLEKDSHLRRLFTQWKDLLTENSSDPSMLEEEPLIETSYHNELFQALQIEMLRRRSDLAGSATERDRLLRRAQELLRPRQNHSPELRIQSCLLALDQRVAGRITSRCEALRDNDYPLRAALRPLLRWYASQDKEAEIDRFLEEHEEASGAFWSLDFVRAERAIGKRDFPRADALLDRLPSTGQDSAEFSFLKGQQALAQGELARGVRHLRQAQARSPHPAAGPDTSLVFAELLLPEEARSLDEEEMENLVRRHLRHGEYGPTAWAVFALLRHHQGRGSDARENLQLARQNQPIPGGRWEEEILLFVELELLQQTRGPGHRSVEALLEQMAEAAFFPWLFHLQAARFESAQRRPATAAITRNLRAGLQSAPTFCPLWLELDNLPRRLQQGILRDLTRPEECR